MPPTISEKNRQLDSMDTTHVSLHSALPNETGSNEISGGAPAYARKAGSWAATANGQRLSTAPVTFDVPGGGTVVKYVGFWTALTGGTFRHYAVAGGNPFSYRVDVAGNVIEALAHGLSNDELAVFFYGVPPAPLVAGTEYFVISATADDFQVSLTQGGAAVVLTDQGDAQTRASLIVPETFGAQGTHQVQSYPLDQNF